MPCATTGGAVRRWYAAQTDQLAPRHTVNPVAAGPSPETRNVAELAHAMWFDSEEDTLDFLLKAGLEPEQSSTGTWQLVLHRSLRVDPQAASFRQRSARLCDLQAPTRYRPALPSSLPPPTWPRCMHAHTPGKTSGTRRRVTCSHHGLC